MLRVTAGRKPGPPDDRSDVRMILTEADLAAALDDLVTLDPGLAAVRALAGIVPLRRIDPGFAGLALIVTGQQISTLAQTAIFARMEAELGGVTAGNMAAASDEQLRRAGQSAGKMRTLRAAAQAVVSGDLDLAALSAGSSEDAVAALTDIPGIGRWTAESFLLFAAGHRDVFPAADIALQEAARVAFALEARPAAKHLLVRAEAWRPLRSVAARLLWAYYRADRDARRIQPKLT